VIKKPQKTTFKVKQQGDVLNLTSEKMRVSLNVKSGAVTYYAQTGNLLLKEKEGSANFTSFNDAGSNTFTVFQAYTLDADEAIYGLGQQQAGRMIQRNLTLNMVQNNTSDYVPFFQSVKGLWIILG
jgi:alpha-D-xyloside xylohydrolase